MYRAAMTYKAIAYKTMAYKTMTYNAIAYKEIAYKEIAYKTMAYKKMIIIMDGIMVLVMITQTKFHWIFGMMNVVKPVTWIIYIKKMYI